MKISTRQIGRIRPLVPDWNVPWEPDDDGDGGEPVTLRQVITRIVHREVESFRERTAAQRLTRILTQRQIADGLSQGRVIPGGRDLQQEVDAEQAVANALQSFEDGIYLVILDGEEQRDLDREVHVDDDSQLTFVRLVMLAGG